MPVFSFTLFVEGVDLRGDDQVDALFEAGCGDALVGLVDGAGRLDFDREAPRLKKPSCRRWKTSNPLTGRRRSGSQTSVRR